MRKNKKGLAPLVLILGVLGFLLLVYLILFIPIPKFKEIRTNVNYFGIIVFWFIFQALLIYGYVKLGQLAYKGFWIYKTKVLNMTHNLRNWIAS